MRSGKKKIREVLSSPRGMYIRSTADIPLNWKDICNIADINELSEIVDFGHKEIFNFNKEHIKT